MKVFHVSWNDPETVFHEMPWKKNLTVYPSLKRYFLEYRDHQIHYISACSFLKFIINQKTNLIILSYSITDLLWILIAFCLTWHDIGFHQLVLTGSDFGWCFWSFFLIHNFKGANINGTYSFINNILPIWLYNSLSLH